MKIKLAVFIFLILAGVGLSYAREGDMWLTVGNVTVRSQPDASSEPVSYFKQGVKVVEVEQSGQWVKVRSASSKVTGWVHRSLLRPLSETDEALCDQAPVKPTTALGCAAQAKETRVRQDQSVQPGPDKKRMIQIKEVVPARPGEATSSVDQTKGTTLQGKEPVRAQNVTEQAQSRALPDKMLEGAPYSSDSTSSADIKEQFSSGVVSGSYTVGPERLTVVKMSSSDVNRIVCPTSIKDVVYSEEKGIQVKIVGQNAFVKFHIKKVGDKEIYSTIPADMYVVCGNKVYSIIAFPERIPSVSVFLEDKETKIKETVEKNLSIPYERRIVNYVRSFITGKIPPEATLVPKSIEYRIYPDIEIKEVANYVIEGEGLTVRVFQITGKKPGVEIKERDFLRVEIAQNPVALSLDRLKLGQGERAVLLIIEKTRG